MPKKSIKAVDVNEIENPSELVPVQERFLLASTPEKTLESQTSDKDIPPCSVLKQKTVEGMTFFYSTEEELRQKVSHELARIQAELEANERELEDLTERGETLGLFCKAMMAFPWLGEALTVYYQRKEALELERCYPASREVQNSFGESFRLTMAPQAELASQVSGIADKRLLSVNELSRYLSMPVATIYTYAHLGRIPASAVVHMGRSLRFEKDGIDRWVNAEKARSTRVA